MSFHHDDSYGMRPVHRIVGDLIAACLILLAGVPVVALAGLLFKVLGSLLLFGAVVGVFKRASTGNVEKDLLITAGYVGVAWVGMGIIVAGWLALAAA